ncbi:MAG: HAD-IA family hydrolase [Myxococcota bacterium]
MPTLDAVLLDLDGTVLDTHALILASWRHVRDRFALRADDDAFRRGMGRPLPEVLSAFARPDAETDALVAEYRAHNDLHHDAMVRAFVGMPEAIATLRAAGVKVAIVTSKSKPFAARGLRLTGIAVDALVSPSDVREPKPAAEPVLHALGLVGVAAERAVMVGDSPHDLASGHAAHVLTAAVTWGAFTEAELAAAHPDRWIREPSALVTLALG